MNESEKKEFESKFPHMGKKPQDMSIEEWNEINRGYQVVLEFKAFFTHLITTRERELREKIIDISMGQKFKGDIHEECIYAEGFANGIDAVLKLLTTTTPERNTTKHE